MNTKRMVSLGVTAALVALVVYAVNSRMKAAEFRTVQALVDRFAPAVFQHMNEFTGSAYTHPELAPILSPEEMQRQYAKFKLMGAYKGFIESHGEIRTDKMPDGRKIRLGAFGAIAGFENGKAVILLEWHKQSGQWKLSGFNIQSKHLNLQGLW